MTKSNVPDFNEIFNGADEHEETEVQRKIREAKAELARMDEADRQRLAPVVPASADADDWEQPLPEPQPPLKAANQIHFFGSITLTTGEDFSASFRSVYTERGMTVTLTDDLLRLNPVLQQLIDDPDEQMRKWHRDEPLFARGPWPEKVRKFLPGSYEEDQARDIARAAAFALTDPVEQAKALRSIDDEFGIKPSSYTLAAYRGGAGR